MEWIPVAVDLPKREDIFIVTYVDDAFVKHVDAEVLYDPVNNKWNAYDYSYESFNEDITDCVIAWMEKPKPY